MHRLVTVESVEPVNDVVWIILFFTLARIVYIKQNKFWSKKESVHTFRWNLLTKVEWTLISKIRFYRTFFFCVTQIRFCFTLWFLINRRDEMCECVYCIWWITTANGIIKFFCIYQKVVYMWHHLITSCNSEYGEYVYSYTNDTFVWLLSPCLPCLPCSM